MSTKSVEFSFSEFCAVTAARPGVRAWCCEAVVGRRPGVGVGGLHLLPVHVTCPHSFAPPRYVAVGGTSFFISRQR